MRCFQLYYNLKFSIPGFLFRVYMALERTKDRVLKDEWFFVGIERMALVMIVMVMRLLFSFFFSCFFIVEVIHRCGSTKIVYYL